MNWSDNREVNILLILFHGWYPINTPDSLRHVCFKNPTAYYSRVMLLKNNINCKSINQKLFVQKEFGLINFSRLLSKQKELKSTINLFTNVGSLLHTPSGHSSGWIILVDKRSNLKRDIIINTFN